MRVTIHLTHHRGIRLGDHQHHPRGELKGELLTYQRTSKRGVITVATLRDPNNHIAKPILELFDVALYLIGPHGLHLRGLERFAVDGRSQFVVQGWVVVLNASGC
jgi:hypothetical protein